jgi:hypothetical protein
VLTWAERGFESIYAIINGNKKDCVIVLASVTVVRANIPLITVAAGKTGRVEQSQIGNVESHWRIQSISDWETFDTFHDSVAKLHSTMGEGQIDLLLDCSSAHRTETVKQATEKTGVALHFIPPGLTDEF